MTCDNHSQHTNASSTGVLSEFEASHLALANHCGIAALYDDSDVILNIVLDFIVRAMDSWQL